MKHCAIVVLAVIVMGCGRGVDTKPVSEDTETQTRLTEGIDKILTEINSESGVDQIAERLKGKLTVPDLAVLKGKLQSIRGATGFELLDTRRHGPTAFRVKAAFTKGDKKTTATLVLTEKDGALVLAGLF